MSRPSSLESRARRDRFKELVAHDIGTGGLDLAHRNVVQHARDSRLDPWHALRLSYDPRFVGEVNRLVRQYATR